MQWIASMMGFFGAEILSTPPYVQSTQELGPKGPWQMMHDWHMWGGGGMWLGPLWMILWLAVLVAVIIALLRWLGMAGTGTEKRERSSREILDELYASGKIDRDEYLRRRQDISGS